ncbi:MAG TPA: DUF1653 domain-containing protein [Alphaproteobacteria bacterium]|nr:DUF1653 domain-containing protein [Alphaproteobacteria bacterium]
MNSSLVEEIFYVDERPYYSLENILDREGLFTQLLFTNSHQVYDQYIHTGELGRQNIFLVRDPSYIRNATAILLSNELNFNCSKIDLGIYRHYKNKDYLVLGTALNLDTSEEAVIYEQLYSDDEYKVGQIWSKSQKEFFEKITSKEYHHKGPRFYLIDKN